LGGKNKMQQNKTNFPSPSADGLGAERIDI